MTPEEEAYALAEERIAEARGEGWRFLNLGGSTGEFEFAGETRAGDERLRHLTRLPPEIAGLTALQRLDLDLTQVADLAPMSGLTALQTLWLNDTQVADLAPLSGLTALRWLYLNGTQVADLAPLAGLENLRDLEFRDIPACRAEPELAKLSEIEDDAERTRDTLAWLRNRLPKEPPEPAPDDVDAALDDPALGLAYSGFAWRDGKVTPIPLAADRRGEPTDGAAHREMVATLDWAARELLRLAAGNRLGTEDARRIERYLALLAEAELNARLLHLIARALNAEIEAAVREQRLDPGDARIAEDFRLAHAQLLETFYPGALQVGPVPGGALKADVTADQVAAPIHEVRDRLTDPDLPVTPELRAAFDELDRVWQGERRREQLEGIARDDERERIFATMATRAAATVRSLYLTVRKRAAEVLATVSEAAAKTARTIYRGARDNAKDLLTAGGSIAAIESVWHPIALLIERLAPAWERLAALFNAIF